MTLLDLLILLVAAILVWLRPGLPLGLTIVVTLAVLCVVRWLLGERIPRRPP